MHSLLTKLLQKRGIKNVEDLHEEEKAQIQNWQKVLSSGDVTVEKVGAFCQNQLDQVESQMRNLDNSTQKNERLILLHSVYKAIKEALHAPQTERETLEKFLISLIETK